MLEVLLWFWGISGSSQGYLGSKIKSKYIYTKLTSFVLLTYIYNFRDVFVNVFTTFITAPHRDPIEKHGGGAASMGSLWDTVLKVVKKLRKRL